MIKPEDYYHSSQFNLYLDASNIPCAGLGVFTRDCIPPNVCIDEYKGDVYKYRNASAYMLEIDTNYYVDARDFPRCYMAMLNDCSHIAKQYVKKKKRKIDITPEAYYDTYNNMLTVNCEMVIDSIAKRAFVYSLSEISPGSELFISYGPDYWH